MKEFQELLTFSEAKRNLNRQATKVLHDMVYVYQQGGLDDPRQAALYCQLLALVCEGKVKGIVDEETATVKWSLTEEYAAQVEQLREAAYKSALNASNVVKGPWQM